MRTKKQVDALKSLNLSYKIDELKQVQSIFLQNPLNDLIIDKLKEIKQLQNNTKLGNLEYTKTETLDYFLVQENKFL